MALHFEKCRFANDSRSQTIPQFTDETFAAALNRIAVNDENENLLEKQEKEIAMTEDIEYIRAQRVVAMVNAAEGKGEAKGRAEEKYSLAKGFLKKGIRQPEVFCQPPAPGFRRMKKRKTPVCLPERQRPGLFKVCKRQPEDSSVPSLWIYRYIAFSAETDKVKSARKSE